MYKKVEGVWQANKLHVALFHGHIMLNDADWARPGQS